MAMIRLRPSPLGAFAACLLLAAPTIASVRVLGGYIYRRLLDIEPYVSVKKTAPPMTTKKAVPSTPPLPAAPPAANPSAETES